MLELHAHNTVSVSADTKLRAAAHSPAGKFTISTWIAFYGFYSLDVRLPI